MDIYDAPLKEGFAKTGGKKSLDNFDVAPFVTCIMGRTSRNAGCR